MQRAITDFANQWGSGRMNYASRVAANEPIGSGVTQGRRILFQVLNRAFSR